MTTKIEFGMKSGALKIMVLNTFKSVFILLFIHNTYTGYSKDLNLNFSHLTSQEGLSNNTIHCIYQDSKGFLWIGTSDGLNLFNGYEFEIFKYNAQDTSSLSSNSVFGILEDSKGRLWIAGSTGIDIFDWQTISFKHIPFVDEFNPSAYQSYTRAIIEDKEGNIIIANTTGVFVYDTLKCGFVRFLKDIPNFGALGQEGIRALLIDKNERIWIGSIGYGLYCYDLKLKEAFTYRLRKAGVDINERTYTIAEDSKDDIWIGTDNGIYIVKSDLSEVRTFKGSKGLSSNNIRHIYVENDQRIWIGTIDGGLCLYDESTNSFSCYQSNESNIYSLNNNSVQSIWKDRQGILWVGTIQGGVNYSPIDYGLRFKLITSEKGNSNSLIYDAVSALYEDKEGNIWIGTDGGGLDYYNRKAKTFRHYRYIPGGANTISGNSILAITEDSRGNIWIGGYLFGINIIDRVSGGIVNLKNDPDNPNSLSSDDVRDILISNDTTVWIATNGGGVDRYNPQTGIFYHYRQGPDNSIVNNWCIKLFKDSYGILWIGTYDGLSIYDQKTDRFNNYSHTDKAGSLSNSWVYAFAEDKSGDVWIGTANGLNHFHRETQVFTPVYSSIGFLNEVINGILIDDHENLWLSTNNGISKFNPTNSTVKKYDVFDGLQGNQFIHGSYLKTNTGEMFFGGLDGLNYFYPDSIKDNQFKPEVYLTDFLLFFEPANVNIPGSPLSKSITVSDKIVLTHKQSVITFKYAALNYFSPEKNQYQYILEGSEKEWNNVGTRREATYTNLNPGKYIFKVKASNNDGIWNEQATSLRLIILPPWWKTLFFKILIVLIITSAIVGYYFFRISSLKKQQRKLEELVESRTKEIKATNSILAQQTEELSESNTLLEERQQMIEEQTEELVSQKEELERVNENLKELNLTKDKFFSIIAHDLKNPFNTILGFAELLDKNYDRLSEDKRRSFSKAIHDSSENVYNLLENLLHWARSQTDSVKIAPVAFTINDLIEENIELLKEMFNKKNINIRFESDGKLNVFADRNMVNTVIRNLLTNAVKFTNEKGEVIISLRKEENKVLLEVKDNGIGISEEDKTKLFEIDGHILREGTSGELGTGLGLILCKEYIEKNKGKISVESKVEKGSMFQIILPTAT
ncbi:MAG: hypothetical protein JXB24_03755 [Bacteroidales bacterium]|nr:hypothetical protein [Bacteroidales bacterium]